MRAWTFPCDDKAKFFSVVKFSRDNFPSTEKSQRSRKRRKTYTGVRIREKDLIRSRIKKLKLSQQLCRLRREESFLLGIHFMSYYQRYMFRSNFFILQRKLFNEFSSSRKVETNLLSLPTKFPFANVCLRRNLEFKFDFWEKRSNLKMSLLLAQLDWVWVVEWIKNIREDKQERTAEEFCFEFLYMKLLKKLKLIQRKNFENFTKFNLCRKFKHLEA